MKKLTCDEFISLIEGKIIGVEPHTGAGIKVSPNRAIAWFQETVDSGGTGFVGVSLGYVWLGSERYQWKETYKVGGFDE